MYTMPSSDSSLYIIGLFDITYQPAAGKETDINKQPDILEKPDNPKLLKLSVSADYQINKNDRGISVNRITQENNTRT